MFSFTVRRLIGAAAVVCLGASAVVVGSVAVPARTLALPGASESTVVMIEPTRVADTRYNIGLPSRIAAKAPRKMTVTGLIDTYIESTETTVIKQVVPAGATGVFLNVTVVAPGGPGFLAIRPGTATGVPATAGLNFGTETALANGILVALPATGNNAGQIDLYYGTPAVGVFTDVIIDVVGYTTSSGLIDLVKRIEQLETSETSSTAGSAGGAGADGVQGIPGNNGTNGADGIPVRRYGRTITSLSTLDNTGTVGKYTSIAVGADGNPIISYWDVSGGALKVAACTNPTCTTATLSIVDNTGGVGSHTSITIGADANPIISYWDYNLPNASLKVAACTNPTCNQNISAATLSTVDTGNVGEYTSMTIGADANPIISYFDDANDELKVAACTNPTCNPTTSLATLSTVDDTGDVGEYTSITIGADANPIISYYDDTNDELKVAACTNPTCDPTTSPATLSTVDTGDVGEYTSIVIGADANPIISYFDDANDALKVAACTNPTCDPTTSLATLSTVDDTGDVGWDTSITIGADANPIISYYDFTSRALKVAACTNPTCNPTASPATLSTVDTGNVGEYTSITIGADANPIISYYYDDGSGGALKVAKLTRTSWTPNTWES
jgi:hypothetical protein